jgi:glucose/arabinose dehydrogenase
MSNRFSRFGSFGIVVLGILAIFAISGCTASGTPAVIATPTQGSQSEPEQPIPLPTSTLAPVATATQVPATIAVPTSTPQPTPTTSPTPTSAPSPTTLPQPSAKTPTFDIQVLVKGLDTPWALAFAPDGRIFITERPGRIRIVKNGQLQAEPWMTLDVAEAGEGGLLGLALDPQFAQNHFVYVAYTYRANSGRLQNRLVRLRDDPASDKGGTDKVLLDGVLGNSNHDGGRVKFGPDGKLYWTTGDAQNGNLAQDLSALNGKILRLNPDGSIPNDNPFPNSPVYSYGHRNPEGLAWQPGTGRLYETEHGPSGVPSCCLDEVNLIEPGKNYGWPVIMGNQTHAGMISPILQSGNNTTWAPSGAAFITRGPWAGSLFFAGLRGQSLYWLILDPDDPRKVIHFEPLLVGQFGRLRGVVEGPDGALYITTSNRDGRGNPAPDDDRVIRLALK